VPGRAENGGMQIVQGDEQPVNESRTVRGGELRKRYLLTSEDGPGNFLFVLAYQTGDFYSPRHHHNFDQFRFQIDGECSFDKNGTMKPGTLGYFTEGSYYGPQTSNGPNTVAVVQFGGPSGNGYLTLNDLHVALEAMKKTGRFDQGVYYRNEGVPGKKTMDSFQATWEFARERPMVYPKPQYADPIMMDTNNYRWMPLAGEPGVEEKSYGTFTDCKIRCASYKLDPGAALRATGRGIYYVQSGRGTIANEPFRPMTSVYLDDGEDAAFQALETSEILLLGLPEVARMRIPMPGLDAAELEDLAEV
jgi:hypothetical protein